MRFWLWLMPLAWLPGCSADDAAPGTDPAVLTYLERTLWTPSHGGRVGCGYETLGTDEAAGERFVWAVCGEYVGDASVGGRSGPVALRLGPEGPTSHREPRDGSAYSTDVARLFPEGVRAAIHDPSSETHRGRTERLLTFARGRTLQRAR